MQPGLNSPPAVSSSDSLCTRKDFVKVLKGLASRLQALIDTSISRSENLRIVEANAKQEWLNAEAQHEILQRAVEEQELDLKYRLKLASGLHALVRDDTNRLTVLQDNITKESRLVEEDEAVIREQLANLTDPPSVRAAANGNDTQNSQD